MSYDTLPRALNNREFSAGCMHCGASLYFIEEEESDYYVDYIVTHPMWHSGIESIPEVSTRITYTGFPKNFRLAIEEFIRTKVHPPKQQKIHTRTDYPGATPWNDSEFKEAVPDKHLLDVLKPLIGPHVEAIGIALHITEALGPMQQWSLKVSDDCGFDADIIFRVKRTGSCFDNVRRERDVMHRDSMGDKPTSGSHSHPEATCDESYPSSEQDTLLRSSGERTTSSTDS